MLGFRSIRVARCTNSDTVGLPTYCTTVVRKWGRRSGYVVCPVGFLNTVASGRIYAVGWQGGSATTVSMKVRSWGQYRWSAVESYAWSPSHDQCGILRPFGTSSADWW